MHLRNLNIRMALAALGALLASPATAQPVPTFTDIGLEAGFQDRLQHGRALVADDFNGDGWVDLYLGNPGNAAFPDENFILLNNGPDADGDISFRKGQVLLSGEIAFTASAPDFDNDGDPDLFIGIGGQEGIGLDYLFRNDDGLFVDVSSQSGLRGPLDPLGRPVPVATSSGTWADYDNDGDLDLYVAARNNPSSLPAPLGDRSVLYRNNNDGTFTDVTKRAGIDGDASEMTAAWGDFDDDGWMDLYVPRLRPTGFALYRNQADGTFQRVPISPVSLWFGDRATWASSVADVNQDGRLDIISWGRRANTNPASHALLVNRGAWTFTNEAVSSGFAAAGVQPPATMGTALGDLNNDGFPELYVGNGGPSFGEADRLFLNTTAITGALSFRDVSPLLDFPAADDPGCVPPDFSPERLAATWIDHDNMQEGSPGDGTSVDSLTLETEGLSPCTPPYPYRGHGSVMVDFDKDGDLDLAAIKGGTAIIAPQIWSGEPNRLYRNDGDNLGNWLFLSLEGTLSNRDAFGARIEVDSSAGGERARTIVRQVQGETGFSAEGPREIHFGLGTHDQVDQIRIWWPSGAKTVLGPQAVNQRIFVSEDLQQRSDFNDGSLDPWQPVGGRWSVRNGTLVQAGTAPAMAVIAGDEADFSLVAKLTAITAGSRIGLMGRTSPDGRSFYAVILAGSRAQLYRFVDGQRTPLGDPLPIFPMARGRSYIVNLSFKGAQIGFEVDRRSNPLVEDTALTSGGIAVGTFGAPAAFDNVATY